MFRDSQYAIEAGERGGVLLGPPSIRAGRDLVDFLLLRADEVDSQRAEVQVVDAEGNVSLDDVKVYLSGRGDKFEAVDGRPGIYRSPPLVKGRYELRVRIGGGPRRVVPDVHLVPGGIVAVVRLDGGATVEGSILLADDHPARDCVLEVEGAAIQIDEAGRFRVSGLPIGTFVVKVRGRFVQTTEPTLRIAPGMTSGVILRVEAAGMIALDMGAIPSGKTLKMHARPVGDPAGRDERSVSLSLESFASIEGPFQFGIMGGLPPGRYVVDVQIDDKPRVSKEIDVVAHSIASVRLD